MEKTINLYEVLGVPRDATPFQIKSAYRKKASSVHPDRKHGDQAKMAELNVAHDVLSDPKRRRMYDETGFFVGTERTREQEVRAMFVRAVHSVINDKGNVVANLRRTMSEAVDEGRRLINEAEENVRQSKDRVKRLKRSKDADPLLLETIEAHASRGEEIVAKARDQMSILIDARKLIDGYESDEEDSQSESGLDTLEALLTTMSKSSKFKRM